MRFFLIIFLFLFSNCSVFAADDVIKIRYCELQNNFYIWVDGNISFDNSPKDNLLVGFSIPTKSIYIEGPSNTNSMILIHPSDKVKGDKAYISFGGIRPNDINFYIPKNFKVEFIK